MSSFRFPEAKQPYDTTLEENMSMYDKLPYKRNAEMCNASTLAIESGNLVKYYRCAPAETKEIKTQDDKFKSIVSAHIQEYEKNIKLMHKRFPLLYSEEHSSDFSELEGNNLQDLSDDELAYIEDQSDQFNE